MDIENHHHKIRGARLLSDEEVALMNEGKDLAELVGIYIEKLRLHPDVNRPDSGNFPVPLDQRWISIGATDLQRGFMAVIRGIAQPTTF